MEHIGGNMSKNKTVIISTISTLVIGVILYYFILPPINLSSPGFWSFLITLVVIFSISSFVLSIDTRGRLTKLPKIPMYCFGGVICLIAIIVLMNFILSPLFQASSYAKRIDINETAKFSEDIAQVNFQALPLLDKDSSQKLGDRVMGQMPELVSQFAVSNLYTQINYNDKIIRVTPLEYEDWIKYFSNRKEGVKGYISVDSVTGESTLTKLEKGMKYLPSAMFGEDLYRHLRLKYPFDVFEEENFEIDNEGNPYWVVPIMKYTGVGLKRDVSGVVTVNPINGATKKYSVKDVPTWIDHVYNADVIIEQVDNWGQYRGGFLNSLFGQKNVVHTTTGYNYTTMNDDVYLYTGVTSAVADEANLGFIMSNMRTKETKFYSVPGAQEASAMASAEGQVQQMKYRSTFPLLINLNDKPTYLVSLKDNAGLVKMYGFVDVADYQKVVVTDAAKGIEEAAKNYLGGAISSDDILLEKVIQVANIDDAIIDGNSYYYITDTAGKRYSVSLKTNKDLLPFVSDGDKLTISYHKEQPVTLIVTIK